MGGRLYKKARSKKAWATPGAPWRCAEQMRRKCTGAKAQRDGAASVPEENHESAGRSTQKQQLATLQANLNIIEIKIKAVIIFMSLMVLLRNKRRTALEGAACLEGWEFRPEIWSSLRFSKLPQGFVLRVGPVEFLLRDLLSPSAENLEALGRALLQMKK